MEKEYKRVYDYLYSVHKASPTVKEVLSYMQMSDYIEGKS